MNILLKQLQETSKVFLKFSGRAHRTFPKFRKNGMNSIAQSKLSQWMEEQMHKVIKYN